MAMARSTYQHKRYRAAPNQVEDDAGNVAFTLRLDIGRSHQLKCHVQTPAGCTADLAQIN